MEPVPPFFEPVDASPRPILPIERLAAALEVDLCSGFPTQFIIISVLTTFGMKTVLPGGAFSPPFVFTLTLTDTIVLVGLVLFLLRSHGESVRGTLFAHRSTLREALVGVLLIPASFLVAGLVLVLVQLTVPSLRNVLHNPLQDLARTRLDAAVFSLTVMIAGGVREEIQRGFVLHRFEQYLGGGWVGIMIFSIVFGLGHLEQGYDVALATAA
ncbi:MAG TPA: CPBP family intramembrane glutamic endopeptidase, partial [Vicinamibacterales bacterium]|nr:CPBP family intramembrane glutamic endopeptidase [Vicinamibacterales bacterium]